MRLYDHTHLTILRIREMFPHVARSYRCRLLPLPQLAGSRAIGRLGHGSEAITLYRVYQQGREPSSLLTPL